MRIDYDDICKTFLSNYQSFFKKYKDEIVESTRKKKLSEVFFDVADERLVSYVRDYFYWDNAGKDSLK